MIPQLRYQDSIFSRPVDDAVFVVYTARPVAGKPVFERFRLAGPCERVAHDLIDEPVDAFEHDLVGLKPVLVVLPGMFGKDELHSASLRSVPPPRSSSAMDSSRRRAFLGARKRYDVSSSAL